MSLRIVVEFIAEVQFKAIDYYKFPCFQQTSFAIMFKILKQFKTSIIIEIDN